MEKAQISAIHQAARDCIDAAAAVVRGNRHAVEVVVAALLARGHVLLEDVPGVGKTTLARAVARVMGCSFARIQFTADMLPGDVLGVQLPAADGADLRFRPGPIFHQLVLADEINRASPRTQSAMLEAMAEGQVTIDDTPHELPAPFAVLATQNPVEHHGAYPLPESQLDRFMVNLSIGYPPPESERELLRNPRGPADALAAITPIMGGDDLLAAQRAVEAVAMEESVAQYLLAIVAATREHPDLLLGCSPRGALAFAALLAWAFCADRDFVTPDDVQLLASCALAHRVVVAGAGAVGRRAAASEAIKEIVGTIPVPR